MSNIFYRSYTEEDMIERKRSSLRNILEMEMVGEEFEEKPSADPYIGFRNTGIYLSGSPYAHHTQLNMVQNFTQDFQSQTSSAPRQEGHPSEYQFNPTSVPSTTTTSHSTATTAHTYQTIQHPMSPFALDAADEMEYILQSDPAPVLAHRSSPIDPSPSYSSSNLNLSAQSTPDLSTVLAEAFHSLNFQEISSSASGLPLVTTKTETIKTDVDKKVVSSASKSFLVPNLLPQPKAEASNTFPSSDNVNQNQPIKQDQVQLKVEKKYDQKQQSVNFLFKGTEPLPNLISPETSNALQVLEFPSASQNESHNPIPDESKVEKCEQMQNDRNFPSKPEEQKQLFNNLLSEPNAYLSTDNAYESQNETLKKQVLDQTEIEKSEDNEEQLPFLLPKACDSDQNFPSSNQDQNQSQDEIEIQEQLKATEDVNSASDTEEEEIPEPFLVENESESESCSDESDPPSPPSSIVKRIKIKGQVGQVIITKKRTRNFVCPVCRCSIFGGVDRVRLHWKDAHDIVISAEPPRVLDSEDMTAEELKKIEAMNTKFVEAWLKKQEKLKEDSEHEASSLSESSSDEEEKNETVTVGESQSFPLTIYGPLTRALKAKLELAEIEICQPKTKSRPKTVTQERTKTQKKTEKSDLITIKDKHEEAPEEEQEIIPSPPSLISEPEDITNWNLETEEEESEMPILEPEEDTLQQNFDSSSDSEEIPILEPEETINSLLLERSSVSDTEELTESNLQPAVKSEETMQKTLQQNFDSKEIEKLISETDVKSEEKIEQNADSEEIPETENPILVPEINSILERSMILHSDESTQLDLQPDVKSEETMQQTLQQNFDSKEIEKLISETDVKSEEKIEQNADSEEIPETENPILVPEINSILERSMILHSDESTQLDLQPDVKSEETMQQTLQQNFDSKEIEKLISETDVKSEEKIEQNADSEEIPETENPILVPEINSILERSMILHSDESTQLDLQPDVKSEETMKQTLQQYIDLNLKENEPPSLEPEVTINSILERSAISESTKLDLEPEVKSEKNLESIYQNSEEKAEEGLQVVLKMNEEGDNIIEEDQFVQGGDELVFIVCYEDGTPVLQLNEVEGAEYPPDDFCDQVQVCEWSEEVEVETYQEENVIEDEFKVHEKVTLEPEEIAEVQVQEAFQDDLIENINQLKVNEEARSESADDVEVETFQEENLILDENILKTQEEEGPEPKGSEVEIFQEENLITDAHESEIKVQEEAWSTEEVEVSEENFQDETVIENENQVIVKDQPEDTEEVKVETFQQENLITGECELKVQEETTPESEDAEEFGVVTYQDENLIENENQLKIQEEPEPADSKDILEAKSIQKFRKGSRKIKPAPAVVPERRSQRKQTFELRIEKQKEVPIKPKAVPIIKPKPVPIIKPKPVPIRPKEVPIKTNKVPIKTKEIPIKQKEVSIKLKEVPTKAKPVIKPKSVVPRKALNKVEARSGLKRKALEKTPGRKSFVVKAKRRKLDILNEPRILPEIFQCSGCDHEYPRKGTLKSHIHRKHSQDAHLTRLLEEVDANYPRNRSRLLLIPHVDENDGYVVEEVQRKSLKKILKEMTLDESSEDEKDAPKVKRSSVGKRVHTFSAEKKKKMIITNRPSITPTTKLNREKIIKRAKNLQTPQAKRRESVKIIGDKMKKAAAVVAETPELSKSQDIVTFTPMSTRRNLQGNKKSAAVNVNESPSVKRKIPSAGQKGQDLVTYQTKTRGQVGQGQNVVAPKPTLVAKRSFTRGNNKKTATVIPLKPGMNDSKVLTKGNKSRVGQDFMTLKPIVSSTPNQVMTSDIRRSGRPRKEKLIWEPEDITPKKKLFSSARSN